MDIEKFGIKIYARTIWIGRLENSDRLPNGRKKILNNRSVAFASFALKEFTSNQDYKKKLDINDII